MYYVRKPQSKRSMRVIFNRGFSYSTRATCKMVIRVVYESINDTGIRYVLRKNPTKNI